MDKVKRSVCIMMAVSIMCAMLLTGCNKDETEKPAESSNPSEVNVVEEKDYLKVQTSIAYSSGDTTNWTYGNQRKEFPDNDSCYVRIASTAITTGSFGKGNGDTIEVTYRFTGTADCKIVISDGKAVKVDTGDENITEYTRTITAAKEKSATEDILIFRYSPKGAESVTLEVFYDDQVAEKFDEYNTVYFYEATEN